MTEFLFATEHVQTSQGWFLPGHLMPKLDLPEDETLKLLEEKKAALCAHDSPLAKAVHDSRKLDPHAASVFLKGVMETLSPMSPGDEPVELEGSDTEPPPPDSEHDEDDEDDDWVDPTPKGELPTLENFVRAGNSPGIYESYKTSFFEEKQRMADEKAAAAAKELTDAAEAKAAAEKKAEAESTLAAAKEAQTITADDVGSVDGVLNPPATESTTTEPTESK